LTIQRAQLSNGTIEALVRVENLAGHKLPTGYPSRRVWIEFTVRNATGETVFRSGALEPDGSVLGNDNDRDPGLFEPHHSRISSAEQVQVYESIMAAPDGSVTTGLLTAVDYLKDNRLLPSGFDKGGGVSDIAVRGAASEDEDFVGGSDEVLYSVAVPSTAGPLQIEAILWFQPIGRRWAENLRAYDAAETNRFVAYYDSMAGASATILARSIVTIQ
jgi:hypothetical protein